MHTSVSLVLRLVGGAISAEGHVEVNVRKQNMGNSVR